MIEIKTGTLKVPGASLYYEVCGEGPVLLMIHGGGGDAESYRNVANQLAKNYTVVTYDRRGYSRSNLDNSAEEQRLEIHGNDAHLLLAEITSKPAYVFGCSAGALIGLDLVACHQEQVHTLVAHEPPAQDMLSEGEKAQLEQSQKELEETFRNEGPAAAIRKFSASIGINHNDSKDQLTNIGRPQNNAIMSAKNKMFFFTQEARAVNLFKLETVSLKAVSTRIILAGGSESRDFFPYKCAIKLADRIKANFVEFPGNHAGFVNHPEEFAVKLNEVFVG